METKHKRIAANTFILYVWMLLLMCISFYTSREVLAILGVVDQGIYNIVGGIISIMSFLVAAMSTATQRFLSFQLGANNFIKLKRSIFLLNQAQASQNH